MEWRDRNGLPVYGDERQDRTLHFWYETMIGKLLLPVLTKPLVSKTAGWLMERSISRIGIKPFLKKSHIDMDEYEDRKFRSFNDFFTRRIKPERRPVDQDPTHLISPCDAKLSVWAIERDRRFTVKNSEYTLEELLQNRALANSFSGGMLLLFRLTVDDYHRYCYPDSGIKENNVHIQGAYYTVNPIAYGKHAVYKENTREYTILHSQNFDDLLIMEVGATMVGRISNLHSAGQITKGEEKGHFDFGGSSLIICIKPGIVRIDDDILRNTAAGYETVVKYGEKIGEQ